MTGRLWVIGTAIAIAIGTWLAGWWAVPVIALLVGATRRVPPYAIAIAALAAWSALLVIDSTGSGMAALEKALGGIMGVPTFAVIVLTWLFPALLAWSSATIGDSLSS